MEIILGNSVSPEVGYSITPLEATYVASFPEEERRPWADIVNPPSGMSTAPIIYYGEVVGLITVWHLELACFVEHFFLHPSYRNKGIGGMAMRRLMVLTQPKPLVLECERAATGDIASRRLLFYERLGFEVLPIDYVQPPYQKHLCSVPMLLLSTGYFDTKECEALRECLHQKVYGIG